jgi:superfamily II DNA or RNA helicase
MSKSYRYYQDEADSAIYEELLINNKCLVKMFCGTGKSLLMRKCKVIQEQKLVVYVFPSLNLIDQFYNDYLNDFPSENVLKISSEAESTTDTFKIINFLSKYVNKIICVTYQSFKTLLDCLENNKINICLFDEAHHAVGEIYQKLIFENNSCEKQIFFTATPNNSNGIIMYDRDNLEAGMCGKLVYDYSYLTGCFEGYLNPFEIRIDMYTENTNKSVYESIARSIIASGNNRVLTFHSDVNTDRDTSVNNFVDEDLFVRTFREVCKNEFPEKVKYYKKVKMIGLSANIKSKERKEFLNKFDKTPNNEVIVISSCETIGEGIDTKNANMCVFVDPKSSYIKIIQNIGRIVRKQFGINKPNSTILIPCWVDKSKYLVCEGDREKCDEVIRTDMSKDGNFNGILNVLSALKQEDEDLYDICLHYPDTFSPQELKGNLEKQGYTILEPIGEGSLIETAEHLLDAEEGLYYELYEECESDQEMIIQIAEDNDVCIEIHTNSLENPIEIYNSECESGEIIRLYKSVEEIYQPIVKKENSCKRNSGKLYGPKRERRMNVNVHTNPDVKVLWNITRVFDITKDICSCVIDCEVVKYDPMEVAMCIVERANERLKKGSNLLPKKIYIKENRKTLELEQEHKDTTKLSCWKMALNNNKYRWKCSNEIRNYLDTNLYGWRDFIDFEQKAINNALEIIERAKIRENNGGKLLPRPFNTKKLCILSESEKTERRDYTKLSGWREAMQLNISGGGKKIYCYDSVRDLLDINLPGWRCEFDRLKRAEEIVKRANERFENGGLLLPRNIYKKENRNTPELEQEKKDATSLGNWNQSIKKNNIVRCPIEVIQYLDTYLCGWRDERDYELIALQQAKDIVQRAKDRNDGIAIPPVRHSTETNELLIQETKDANLIGKWKMAYYQTNKKSLTSYDSVNIYLDENLPEWRDEIHSDENKLLKATQIIERSIERQKKGENTLPRNIEKSKRITKELEQEAKDARDIQCWKRACNGTHWVCPDKVKNYLDEHLPGWRTNQSLKSMNDAEDILKRALIRQQNGNKLLPRDMLNSGKKKDQLTSIEEQEHNDNQKLSRWRNALDGKGTCTCSDELREYLDINLFGWRQTMSKDNENVIRAINIFERSTQRKEKGCNFLPKQINIPSNSDEEQEKKDNQKLRDWRDIKHNLNADLVDYLDMNLSGWSVKNDTVENAMKTAKEIVERANKRKHKGLNILPRETDKRDTPENEQEYKDAIKIGRWRRVLSGKLNGHGVCPEEVYKYLDENLTGWRNESDKMLEAISIVTRANERKNKNLNIIPRLCCNDKSKRDRREYDDIQLQEHKDSEKIKIWKYVLEGKRKGICLDDNICLYLDQNLSGWRPIKKNNSNESSNMYIQSDEEEYTFIPKKKSMKLKQPTEKKESIEQKRERVKSEISQLHQKYKSLKSENLHMEFNEHTELWHKYHEISEENEKSFPEEEIPRNRIILELDKIKTNRTKLVVDMGCGKAHVAHHFQNDKRFEFINYDHISANDNIIECDISRTQLEDNSVEICILSLAMWGSNCKDYIKEAHRILESNGILYIIEATKRWSEKDENKNIIVGKEASRLKKILEDDGFQIKVESIEKFCMFVCSKKD